MNYALAHNGASPLREVIVRNDSDERLVDLGLEIDLHGPVSGPIAEPLRATLPPIDAHDEQVFARSRVPWRFDPGTFAGIDEAVTATVSARLFDRRRTLQAQGLMRLLAHDEWWAPSIPESLAAFVTPRAAAILAPLLEAGLLIPVETTAACIGDHPSSFADARQGTRHWWTDDLEQVRCLIDVSAAHHHIRPLPAISLQHGVRVVEVERALAPEAPVPSRAPSAAEPPRGRGGARPKAQYPPRVAQWRSSLLAARPELPRPAAEHARRAHIDRPARSP